MDKLANYWNTFWQDEADRAKPDDGSPWREIPISAAEFMEFWLGEKLSPAQLAAVDAILGPVDDVWSQRYHEALLLWGEGSGKDWLTVRLVAYIAYRLTCLRDPQAYFGVGQGTPIDIINVSKDQEHAKHVWFGQFTDVLKRVKAPGDEVNWFAKHGMEVKDEADIQKRHVRFPNNVRAFSLDSRPSTGEGKNVLVAIFDEIAEFDFQRASQIHSNIENTAMSRFPYHYKLVLLSYKRHDHDYMMTRWAETEGDEDVFRSNHPTWEVNPTKTREMFDKAYAKNPEDAARRFENKGESKDGGYFRHKERITECVDESRHCPFLEPELVYRDLEGLTFHPWFRGGMAEALYRITKRLEEVGGDAAMLTELERVKLLELRAQHENAVYAIHLDLAKGKDGGDAVGFAMAHSYPINPRLDEETEYAAYVDFAIQLRAPVGGEVQFAKIRQFIIEVLIAKLGFNVKSVTLDGYESVDFVQIMTDRGIECKTLSVDRNNEAYDTLKSLIYQHHVNYYAYGVLIRELEELRRDKKGKVDHPEKSPRREKEEGVKEGSKDVADAVAGAIFMAIKEADSGSTWVPL